MTIKTTPRLYKGRRNINVPMDSLFKTVRSIVDAGQEEAFLETHGDLTVAAKPALVNAVKTHLFNAGTHLVDAHAARIVDSDPPPPGSPPSCFPAKRGE